ncbi:SEFIR domain-containing protein [Actinosynnema sp. NPDC020468]|uniref:SEFIR domain-containing protein n=1 Tax=Actinosynnema sp. NPDC020468 TaxID=3154488 RepID=UPI0033E9FE21
MVGPRAFVTYSHDTTAHVRAVRELAEFLRDRDVDVVLDQWVDGPRVNWAEWAERELRVADFVLVVVSPGYLRRVDPRAPDGEGWGARYEAKIIRELLTAEPDHWEPRVLPVLLPGRHAREIPLFLLPHSATHFPVAALTDQGADDLLRALRTDPDRDRAGRLWTPPALADARDRVVSPTRASLTDPARLILPLQERDTLHRVFLPAVRQALADPAVVAVHADAGLGKSVLLGQIHDELAADPDTGVVLVSASAKVRDRPRDAAELDHQFGAAVLRSGPLSDVLAAQRAAGLRPVVLLDTLDLILDAASRPVVVAWLRRVVDSGVPVVFTCRSFEYQTHLEPLADRAPLLATLVDRREVYRLSRAETEAFALAYLRGLAEPGADPGPHGRFLDRLLHLRTTRRTVVEVCGSPLLLALTCRLYAPTGDVPEDLTVARLFDSYWGAHVVRSPRRELSYEESEERGRVCLAGGRDLFARSGTTFVEDFKATDLEPRPAPEVVDELCSTGVLVAGADPAWFRFFHQSFAEWVIARHLAGAAGDRAEFAAALADPVRRGHLAPVLVQLLYAPADPAAYRALTAGLDGDDLLTFRALALAAVTRREVAEVRALAERAVGLSPEHQRHFADAIAGAPEDVLGELVAVVCGIFGEVAQDAVFAVAKALGSVVGRMAADRDRALRSAVEAVLQRRSAMADRVLADEVAHVLLTGFDEAVTAPTDADLLVLQEYYGRTGILGRSRILRLHTTGSPGPAAGLLRVAMANRLPGQVVAEAVAVATLVLDDPEAARGLGWTDWRAVLCLPCAKGWDEVQGELVATAVVDRGTVALADVLALALSADRVPAQRALYVAEKAAVRAPARVVDLLVARPAPRDRRAIGLVRTVLLKTPGTDAGSALRVVEWLEPVVADNRALVVQAMVQAARGHPALLARAMTHAEGLPENELARVVVTVLDACPARGLPELVPHLRPLSTSDRELAGRVAGSLAPWDEPSRRRCVELVLGGSVGASRAAAHRLVTVARELGWFDAELAAVLLATRTPGAARDVAEWIGSLGLPLTPGLAEAVVDAVSARHADPVVEALLDVVAADVRLAGPSVRHAEAVLRSSLAAATRTRARGALRVLRSLLERGKTPDLRPPWLRELVTEALGSPALDGAVDDLERVIVTAGRAFRGDRTSVLDELLARLPELAGEVQLAAARATRLERGESSADFRALAHRATDPRARSFVVRHLA